MQNFFLCVATCIFCVAFSSQKGHAEISLEILSGNIAPERLDELIADNASDPAVSFDLLEQKAKMSAPAQAAELNVVRAALAERYPDLIQSDVVGIRIEAAEFYMKADLLEQALGQLYLAFDRLQDSSANHELMEAVLKNIASLEEKAGREEKARQLRGMIDALPATLDKPPASRSNDPGYAKIEVFYATDRARTGRSFPSRFYGHERADFLDYGVLNVTLPRTHVSGSIITPSIWKLEFSEDPTKHTMLQSVTPLDQKVFYSMAQQSLSDRGASDAFVFVHGYNVSFDTAAKRTAQIAYDMNFAGLPILYSWPSRGATTGYVPDSAVVRLSGRKLTHFLEDFAAKSGAKTVHLIGHSMGNRALTDALELLALRRAPVEVPIFDQVIFAAPDVDQGLFAAVVPTIKPIAKRLTLYASDQDLALRASQKLHGNAPRAGQAGEASLSHSEIDTIDMSGLGDDVLAHSYVANDESAMLDIATLFWRNADPSDRCGLNRHAEKLRVWLFVGAECANLTALSLVSTLRNEGAETRNQVRSVVRRDFQDARQTRAIEPLLLNLVSE